MKNKILWELNDENEQSIDKIIQSPNLLDGSMIFFDPEKFARLSGPEKTNNVKIGK